VKSVYFLFLVLTLALSANSVAADIPKDKLGDYLQAVVDSFNAHPLTCENGVSVAGYEASLGVSVEGHIDESGDEPVLTFLTLPENNREFNIFTVTVSKDYKTVVKVDIILADHRSINYGTIVNPDYRLGTYTIATDSCQ
jgi:hypothetical protein